MTRHELALAMGVSTRTIGQWEAAGMPVITPGGKGRGRTGSYDLEDCRSWCMANDRGQQMRNWAARAPGSVKAPAHVSPSFDLGELLRAAAPRAIGNTMAELGLSFDQAVDAFDALRSGLACELGARGQRDLADRLASLTTLENKAAIQAEAERIAVDLLADWGGHSTEGGIF